MISIPIKNNLFNVKKLQEQMEETVFNYIDTSENWEKAHLELENLVNQVTHYFNEWVDVEGSNPTANTYWGMFIDIVSRLLYFYALTKQHLNEDAEQVSALYQYAVTSLPKASSKLNEETIEEVRVHYNLLPNAKQSPLVVKEQSIQECIANFAQFSIQYR